jgi:hypothetical protein
MSPSQHRIFLKARSLTDDQREAFYGTDQFCVWRQLWFGSETERSDSLKLDYCGLSQNGRTHVMNYRPEFRFQYGSLVADSLLVPMEWYFQLRSQKLKRFGSIVPFGLIYTSFL